MDDDQVNAAVMKLANVAAEFTEDPATLMCLACGLMLRVSRSFEISDQDAGNMFRQMAEHNRGISPTLPH